MPASYSVVNGNLQIIGVKKSEEGFYVCTASNVLGFQQAEAKMTVNVPPYFIKTPQVHVKVRKGERLILPCSARGTPIPDITWSKVGGVLPPGRSQQNDKHVTIESVKFSDRGMYVCRASNIIGLVATQTNVSVFVLPEFTVKPPDIVAYRANKRVSVTCRATGHPKPSVKWSKNGSVINTGVSGTKSAKTMVIRSLTTSHKGLYTCTATNGIGDSVTTYTLISDTSPSTCWRVGSPPSSSWSQSTSHTPDAIDFSVNMDRSLRGYLLWGPYSSGLHSYTVRMEVYDAQGARLRSTFHSVSTSSTTYEVLFSSPVLIRANRWYSAVAHIVGPNAHQGRGGQSPISCNGWTMRFRTSGRSKNGSNQSYGQIPALLLA